MSEHEVHTKLVMDDAASEALHKVKEGFEKVGETVADVQGEIRGMIKQAAAVALGFQFDRGIESVKEMGEEMIHAASETEEHVKALAGVLAMSDKTGASYEELTERAEELHEELAQVGVAAGASAQTMIEAFSMMAERSQKSQDELFDLTKMMAMAGGGQPPMNPNQAPQQGIPQMGVPTKM
jgi:mannose/fructose-specific phosphotransferase system component IIA